jgi:hypothetical protein
MGDSDKLSGRRAIINLPRSLPDLRGQQRDSATKAEALVLREAICGALDILHLFDEGGRTVLVAGGEVQPVNAESMRWIIAETFVEKHVIRKLPGLNYVVEFRPVNPSELAVRALLRADQRDGGLTGKLPMLEVETQGFAAPVAAPPAAPGLPDDHPEVLAGRRTQARYANTGAQTELEKARGAEMVAKYQGQRAAAIEESYPVQSVENE